MTPQLVCLPCPLLPPLTAFRCEAWDAKSESLLLRLFSDENLTAEVVSVHKAQGMQQLFVWAMAAFA